MTTAWPPNSQNPGGLCYTTPDVDINSERERLGGPTFAARCSVVRREARYHVATKPSRAEMRSDH